MFLVFGGIAAFSGMAALLFETLFFRLAGLAFGNSVWASSIVLTGFMAGLGLGNLWALGPGARSRRPARVYAAVEAVAGVSGLLLVLALPIVALALAPFFSSLAQGATNAARLAAVLALLVVPTTAMGAALPILVLAARPRSGGFGPTLGWLYGANCLGAVAGALGGELFLISSLGLEGTALVALGLELTAGALAILASGRDRNDERPVAARGLPLRILLGAAQWAAAFERDGHRRGSTARGESEDDPGADRPVA